MEMKMMYLRFVIACFILGSYVFEANGFFDCNSQGNCVGDKLRCTRHGQCRCLESSDYCDSVVDCDYLEDENVEMCGQKKDDQFRCRSGQCIDEAFACDGHPHCDDQTDEHTFICEKYIQCTKDKFQCRNGECISKNKKCDGVRNCADGSDEDICSEMKSFCVLPTVDGVIYYDKITNVTLSPKTNLIKLHYIVFENCEAGYYKAYPKSFRVCKKNGKWESITEKLCFKMCPPLTSDTLDIKCTLNGKNANCSNLSVPDTIATTSCKPMHLSVHDKLDTPFQLTCQSNGTWNNQLYTCSPCYEESECDRAIHCTGVNDDDGCHNMMNLCVLPIADGVIYYNKRKNVTLSPGTLIKLHKIVSEECEVGYYKSIPNSFRVCGENRNWTSVADKLCLKMCPSLISDTLDIKCTLNGKNANCSNLSIPDTVAIPSCKPMHVSRLDILQNPHELLCQSNGTWNNQLYICYPYCGQGYIKNQILIKNGMKTNVSMAPWNVGVYESMTTTSNNYKLICGGSLIAPNLVVSAAHCFWKTGMTLNMNESLINVGQYKIAVGKYDRSFTVIDSDFTRMMNVDIVYMNNVYDGALGNHAADIAVVVLKNKVVVSNGVAPVCMDWNQKYKVSKGDNGKIVGWGYTETQGPSPVLTEANLPYIEPKYCRSLYSNGFHNFVTTDKFCAGFVSGNESSQGVQNGDSGSGLAFMHSNSYFFNWNYECERSINELFSSSFYRR